MSLNTNEILQDDLRKAFDYDNATGVLTWKIPRKGKGKVGDVAGYLESDGYMRVWFFGKTHQLHRLIWIYVYGSIDDKHIDHINGNRSDNRLENLRLVTPKQNMENRRLQKNNRCGLPGVTWVSSKQRWRAQIKHNGRIYYFGHFVDPKDAHIAYRKAAAELHTHNSNALEVTI